MCPYDLLPQQYVDDDTFMKIWLKRKSTEVTVNNIDTYCINHVTVDDSNTGDYTIMNYCYTTIVDHSDGSKQKMYKGKIFATKYYGPLANNVIKMQYCYIIQNPVSTITHNRTDYTTFRRLDAIIHHSSQVPTFVSLGHSVINNPICYGFHLGNIPTNRVVEDYTIYDFETEFGTNYNWNKILHHEMVNNDTFIPDVIKAHGNGNHGPILVH